MRAPRARAGPSARRFPELPAPAPPVSARRERSELSFRVSGDRLGRFGPGSPEGNLQCVCPLGEAARSLAWGWRGLLRVELRFRSCVVLDVQASKRVECESALGGERRKIGGCVRMSLCLTASDMKTSLGVSQSPGTDRVCPVRRWEASKRSEESKRQAELVLLAR